ncbi:MAG: HD-GYP domain-containing protein [Pseudomonadota bacterium]
MLKRISVQQLTTGMYLKEFCGSWMDHPFWRSSFVITDPQDVATIQASAIKEVWIDVSKGLDLAAGISAISEKALSEHVAESEPLAHSAAVVSLPAKVATAEEFTRAARIISRSKQAVTLMFNEARLGKAVDTEAAQKLVSDISSSVMRNHSALISLARLKSIDDYTYMHSVAVCALMVALAKQLNLDEQQTQSVGLAGLLHDLGKSFIPLAILNKPGKLTVEEFKIIKTHPEAGFQLLEKTPNSDPVALDVLLHHHEKIDGSGYPKGLKAEDISLFAKMGAICDVYDAVTSDRPYKAGWDPSSALRQMAEWPGHFDPQVFQAFVKSLGVYPIGSLVSLKSGRIGVVIDQTSKSLLMPRVKVFFSKKLDARIPPEIVDLSRPHSPERIVSREDPDKWDFPDLNDLWSS